MSDKREFAIEAVGLTKSYPVFQKRSEVLWKGIKPIRGGDEVVAVDNLTFQIRPGEVVGIIGRNGAGKSTLLKMIAGTLGPTRGKLRVRGRISAILELGTGFNMEFTGRENIVTGGMAVGMTRKEIEDKMDWIIEFSELERVIDQPFRTYSSGMQARLTFATSVAVDPEIFIVDEALAAGDNAFVEKCFMRMDEIARSGATVLLVTHNTNLIARFGKRAIWLEEGRMRADGDALEVSKAYEIALYSSAVRAAPAESLPDRLGDLDIDLVGVKIHGTEVEQDIFMQGDRMRIDLDLESKIDSKQAHVVIQICRDDTTVIWTSSMSNHMNERYKPASTGFEFKKGRQTVSIEMPHLLLNSGNYYINVGVEKWPNMPRANDYHIWAVRTKSFGVVRSDNMIVGKAFDSPALWSMRQDAVASA